MEEEGDFNKLKILYEFTFFFSASLLKVYQNRWLKVEVISDDTVYDQFIAKTASKFRNKELHCKLMT